MDINYARRARVVRVIDGDTIEADVDLGFYVTVRERFRVQYIDTPEIVGASRAKGIAAKAFTEEAVLGKEIIIVSVKTDTFRRWLADIYYVNDDGVKNLAEELLRAGLAGPYVR